MITNIDIGSSLIVSGIATFNSGINSLASVTVGNIIISTNEIQLSPTFSIVACSSSLNIYNNNLTSNAISISEDVTIPTLQINSNVIINATVSTSGFSLVGNSTVGTFSQMAFYNGPTLTWLIGPNYINDNNFNIYNQNLKTNILEIDNSNYVTNINGNLNVLYTLSAGSVVATSLVATSAFIETLTATLITAQQFVCMPTDQNAGLHIYGNDTYSPEIAYYDNSNQKIWAVGSTGTTFFVYSDQLSKYVMTIEQSSTPIINLNTYVNVENNVNVTGNFTVSNLIATSANFAYLNVNPSGNTEGLTIQGDYSSTSAAQISFFGNLYLEPQIINYWNIGPNFSAGGEFQLVNNFISVNSIVINTNGTSIAFSGSPLGMTMTINGDLSVTGILSSNSFNYNVISFNSPVNTYTLLYGVVPPSQSSTTPYASTTGTYIKNGNIVTLFVPTLSNGSSTSLYITTPVSANSTIPSAYFTMIVQNSSNVSSLSYGYFYNSTTIYVSTIETGTFPAQNIIYWTN